MQELVDQPVEGPADLGLRPVVQVRKLVEQALELVLLGPLPAVAELADHRARASMVHFRHEAVGLVLDDLAGGGQLAPALGAVPLAGHFEVVDRVEVDAVAVAHRRVEVPRHGQVQNEQRPPLPPALHLAVLGQRDDRLAGAGDADHQVGFGQGQGEPFPRDGTAPPSPGQLDRPVEAAVDHGDVAGPLVAEVLQGLLGHLAGADDQGVLVVEPLEDLLGEVGHGHAGDAHAPLLDAGLRGHAPGDLHRGLKGRVGQRPGRLLLHGKLVGLLDLGEDLRLAHHHAVQAGGHAEQVLHGLAVGVLKQVGGDLAGIQVVAPGEELGHHVAAGHRVAAGGHVQLHPVARRKQHRLDLRILPPQPRKRRAGLLGAKRQALPDGDRRLVVTTADHLQLHAKSPRAGGKQESGVRGQGSASSSGCQAPLLSRSQAGAWEPESTPDS